MPAHDPPRPLDDDLIVLLQACSAELGERVLARVRDAVGDAMRYTDGYVFQHLVDDPASITELAKHLGVTQQAASKQVTGLEARGFVRRRPDPRDARVTLIELSDLGWNAVHVARSARLAVHEEIAELLGPLNSEALLAALQTISDHTGALDRMGHRRLRPEASR